jgi:hypothetical protein
MELSIIYTLGRYILWFFLAYSIYLTYIAVVKPMVFWYKYKKYNNVYVNKFFIPLLGDLYYHVKDMRAGRVHYYHKTEQAQFLKDYDLQVKLEGVNPVILIESNKALEEFAALQPHIIDRAFEYKGLTKAVPLSFINIRTTQKTFDRRKLFSSLLNLNQSSKYIPGMIDACQTMIDGMDDKGNYDFLHQMN